MKRFLVLISALMSAQQPTSPAFEVASIRPHPAPLRAIMRLRISGPYVTMEAYNLPQLVMEAYHLRGLWQVSLAAILHPDELRTVYYDIAARAASETTLPREVCRTMLRSLLADRFKLSAHRETKKMPAYALVVGKNGPKLKPSSEAADCAVHVGLVTGGQSYRFVSCPIAELSDLLFGNALVDRPVVDHTSLTGKYDYRIDAMPHFTSRSEPSDLSAFTAIQRLGLKLEPQMAEVEIIAVDHVEKPTEN